MPVQGGQVWKFERVLVSPSTFQPQNADSLPTATLVVNGVDNAASVTVANVGTGIYTFSVTLPSLVLGDVVQIRVTAIYSGFTYKAIVGQDSAYLFNTISPPGASVYAFTRASSNGVLSLILQNANFANIGDATGLRGSTVAGNLYISLHDADPGATGVQTTSEATYTGYARQAVARDVGGSTWSISAGTATNLVQFTFPICTAGSDTVTYVGIGTALSGVGILLFKGILNTPVGVTVGVTPRLLAGVIVLQGP